MRAMEILLADPQRDLLAAYADLLTQGIMQVTTAFDGTQVMHLLSQKRFDIAVIGQHLPRIATPRLSALLHQEHIPHLVMLDEPVSGRILCRGAAQAYLPFPFTPQELMERIQCVNDLAHSKRTLTWDKLAVDVSNFCFAGTDVLLCDREILLLEKLFAGQSATAQDMPYLTALNEKLRSLRAKAQIRYTAKKGYLLVNAYE